MLQSQLQKQCDETKAAQEKCQCSSQAQHHQEALEKLRKVKNDELLSCRYSLEWTISEQESKLSDNLATITSLED